LITIGDYKGSVGELSFSPDGRTLAVVGADDTIRVREVTTGKELLCFRDDRSQPYSVAFSHGGDLLGSAMSHGTALIWVLNPLEQIEGHGKQTDTGLDALSEELSSKDAVKAHKAVWSMACANQDAVRVLARKLKAVPKDKQERLRELVADLDHEDFARREEASKELAGLIIQAEGLLREALETTKSPEQAKRLKTLLKGRETWAIQDPELLQAVRAIWVLQRIGTPKPRRSWKSSPPGLPPPAKPKKPKPPSTS
jgi:hypothetical protein